MTDAPHAGAGQGPRRGDHGVVRRDHRVPLPDNGPALPDNGPALPDNGPALPDNGPAVPDNAPARPLRPVVAFFRDNPQVLILLIVCVVLGLGTFLAVLFGLLTAGSGQTTGEPSGAILGVHVPLASARWLAL